MTQLAEALPGVHWLCTSGPHIYTGYAYTNTQDAEENHNFSIFLSCTMKSRQPEPETASLKGGGRDFMILQSIAEQNELQAFIQASGPLEVRSDRQTRYKPEAGDVAGSAVTQVFSTV